MKVRAWLALALILCLTVSLAACGSNDTAVYVQSVSNLTGMGGIAAGDRFPGMVVSENVTEIKKDSEKTVKEVLVKEGDDVNKGDKLFEYDTDELQLSLEKKQLELEQLNASIENYQQQIKELEKERGWASGSDKLQYTIQIQTAQVDMNATVVSPIKGRIQSINESGTDRNGNPAAYITIQEVGSYRVKGTIGELQRGSIIEGTRIKITSRTDPSAAWTGTVKLVDYESPSQGSDTDRYYGMSTDSMSASSKYPFYVELDSTDGLILGQHVYLEMLTEGDGTSSGLPLSSAFICFEDDGSAYVWAEKKGKLEKRSITLGEHDEAADTYDVLDGLTLEDYIAFPDEQLCHNGAPTTHEMTASENADMPMDNMGEGGMDMPMEDMPMEDMPMEDMPAEGMDMMPEESISGETGEMPGEDAAAAETVSTEGGVG